MEISMKGRKKLNESILRIGEEKGDRNEGKNNGNKMKSSFRSASVCSRITVLGLSYL
jgi:hypothetical protein